MIIEKCHDLLQKERKLGFFSFFNSIEIFFCLYLLIHKTISTWAHIAGHNIPVLICMVSCDNDSRDKHQKLAILRGFSIFN